MGTQYILVTGANRGLGKAIALQLAQNGYDLILHARKVENLHALKAELSPFKAIQVATLAADLGNPEELKAFLKQLKGQYKTQLYGVVNNAGIARDKAIMYQPESEIDELLAVNLKAPVMIGKTALKIFFALDRGVLINIGSVVGETGNAFQSVYAATKASLVALSKSWAKEVGALGKPNIRVLCISPGFIETDMSAQIPEEVREGYLQQIPSRRLGQAKEIGDLVAFLMGEQAAYINGSEIKINGGLT